MKLDKQREKIRSFEKMGWFVLDPDPEYTMVEGQILMGSYNRRLKVYRDSSYRELSTKYEVKG